MNKPDPFRYFKTSREIIRITYKVFRTFDRDDGSFQTV